MPESHRLGPGAHLNRAQLIQVREAFAAAGDGAPNRAVNAILSQTLGSELSAAALRGARKLFGLPRPRSGPPSRFSAETMATFHALMASHPDDGPSRLAVRLKMATDVDMTPNQAHYYRVARLIAQRRAKFGGNLD